MRYSFTEVYRVIYKSKPRNLYISIISNSWSPCLKSTAVRSSDTLLKCTTLNLCSLTLNFHLLDQSYIEFSIVCRPSPVSYINTTSSTYNRMLKVSSFDMVTPRRNPFISGTKSYISKVNKSAFIPNSRNPKNFNLLWISQLTEKQIL